MKSNKFKQLVVMKGWVRKDSNIETNEYEWVIKDENMVAKEMIQLLIDELSMNYDLMENE